MSSQRALKYYRRPKELFDEDKKRIQEMLGDWAFINWEKEEIVFGSSPVPMEKLGKMIALMQQKCVTVRKSKKESKL